MTRKRRSSTQARFEDTLATAEALLQKRVAERVEAQATLSALAREIPALEQTIRALKVQLNPKEVMPNEPNTIAVTGDHRAETSDIPAEVLAKLPPDYLESYTVPEDDSLPAIDGVDLIPEKKP